MRPEVGTVVVVVVERHPGSGWSGLEQVFAAAVAADSVPMEQMWGQGQVLLRQGKMRSWWGQWGRSSLQRRKALKRMLPVAAALLVLRASVEWVEPHLQLWWWWWLRQRVLK